MSPSGTGTSTSESVVQPQSCQPWLLAPPTPVDRPVRFSNTISLTLRGENKGGGDLSFHTTSCPVLALLNGVKMASADLRRSSSASHARSRATLGHPSTVQPRPSSSAGAAAAPLPNLGFHCGGRQAHDTAAVGRADRPRPNQRTYHGPDVSGPPGNWVGPPVGGSHPIETSQYFIGGNRDRADTRVSRASMVAHPHPPGRDRTQSFAPGGARSLEDFEPPQRQPRDRPSPPEYVSYDPAGPDRRYRHHSQQSAASRSSSLSSSSSRELAGELVGRLTRPLGQFLRSVTHRVFRRHSAQQPQQQQQQQRVSEDDTILWNHSRQ